MKTGAVIRGAGRVMFGVLLAVTLAGRVGPATAEDIQPNRVYPGGTSVESSSAGVSFVTPPGWVGRGGHDGGNQVLVLESNTVEGVGLVIVQSGVTAAQVLTTLSEPLNLGAGVVLRPLGSPVTQGSRIVTRYQSEAYVGRALGVLGPTRNSVIFFFAGPPKHERFYGILLEALWASTTFTPPASAAAPPPMAPPTAPRAPAAPGGLGEPWSDVLPGQALNYFSSYNSGGGGGMASHRVLHLCSDGRFLYSGQGLVTMNVPGASGASGGRDGFRGRWSLESPTPSTAVLVLSVDGGREVRWPLRYDGQKTFLNGQRWLRERSNACR